MPASHNSLEIVTPSIDPFSAKNQDLDDVADAILVRAGLLTGTEPEAAPRFRRPSGEELESVALFTN